MVVISKPPGHVYEALYEMYPASDGWKNKVNSMSWRQVWGIYNDRILRHERGYDNVQKTMSRELVKLSPLAKNSKVNDIWRDKEVEEIPRPTPTKYRCQCCSAEYARDNPDLLYCECCNSKLEEENENGNT